MDAFKSFVSCCAGNDKKPDDAELTLEDVPPPAEEEGAEGEPRSSGPCIWCGYAAKGNSETVLEEDFAEALIQEAEGSAAAVSSHEAAEGEEVDEEAIAPSGRGFCGACRSAPDAVEAVDAVESGDAEETKEEAEEETGEEEPLPSRRFCGWCAGPATAAEEEGEKIVEEEVVDFTQDEPTSADERSGWCSCAPRAVPGNEVAFEEGEVVEGPISESPSKSEEASKSAGSPRPPLSASPLTVSPRKEEEGKVEEPPRSSSLFFCCPAEGPKQGEVMEEEPAIIPPRAAAASPVPKPDKVMPWVVPASPPVKPPVAVKEIHPPGDGAYLLYSETLGGCMSIAYSRTPIDGALAYADARKPVQAFKYKAKTELYRNLTANKKNYYTACCSFVKAARQYGGALRLLPANDSTGQPIVFALHFLDGYVQKLTSEDPPIPMETLDAVCAMPHTSAGFDGVEKMKLDGFLTTGRSSYAGGDAVQVQMAG